VEDLPAKGAAETDIVVEDLAVAELDPRSYATVATATEISKPRIGRLATAWKSVVALHLSYRNCSNDNTERRGNTKKSSTDGARRYAILAGSPVPP